MAGRVSTEGAYRVEDRDGRVVARYITNHAGEVLAVRLEA